jgi:hypothetical protein
VNAENADVQTADTALHRNNSEGIHYFDGVNVFEKQLHVVGVVLQHPEHVSARAITGPEEVGCADGQEGELLIYQLRCDVPVLSFIPRKTAPDSRPTTGSASICAVPKIANRLLHFLERRG